MKKFVAFAIVAAMAIPVYAVDGATVFKTKGCAGCHGADGKKAMPAMGVTPLTSPDIQAKSVADLSTAIAKGKGKMPPQSPKLSAEEVTAVAQYVHSLK